MSWFRPKRKAQPNHQRRRGDQPQADIGQVLHDVRHFAAELRRQTTEIDRELTLRGERDRG